MGMQRLPATSIMMCSAIHQQNNSSFRYRRFPAWSHCWRCQVIPAEVLCRGFRTFSSYEQCISQAGKRGQNSLIWLTSKRTDNISTTMFNSFQEALKALHIPWPLNNQVNTDRRRQVQTRKGAIKICASLIIIHGYWKSDKLCFHPR